VDNAVEAILRAIREEAAVAEAFFVTDDEISWWTWYRRYAAWLGDAPLISISSEELEALLHPPLMQKLRQNVFLPVWRKIGRLRSIGPLVNAARRRIPEEVRARIKEEPSAQDSRTLPPFGLLQRYASRTKFSNEKARRILGYGPLISFDQAAQITERWARWARLV
jgi:nucleoside-diphosphate-sugar epimerase